MIAGTITANAATNVVDFDVVQSFSGINVSNTAGAYTFSASDPTQSDACRSGFGYLQVHIE